MPFHGFSNDPAGNRRLCCVSPLVVKREDGTPYHVLDSDIGESQNADNLKEVRRSMMEGWKHPACNSCWREEERGRDSLRYVFTEKLFRAGNNIEDSILMHESDGTVHENNWQYLDLTLGNICNLKCKMCNEQSSHKILEERQKLGLETKGERFKWIQNSDIVESLKPYLASCYEMNFMGGEPLITREHNDILQALVDLERAHEVRIQYNSNMTTLPKRVLKLWEQFDKIEAGVSIDGYGKIDEYIRYGTNWQPKVDNIFHIKNQNNVNVDFHITLQALNLTKLPDLLLWIAEWSYEISKDEPSKIRLLAPHINYVAHYDYLDAKVLPYKLKAEAFAKLQPVLDVFRSFNYTRVNDWCQTLENLYTEILNEDKEHEFSNLKDIVRSQDKFRYNNRDKILELYPEFEPYWERVEND